MESKIRNYYKTNKVDMKMRIRAWRRKHLPSFEDRLFDRAAKFAETCLETGDKRGVRAVARAYPQRAVQAWSYMKGGPIC